MDINKIYLEYFNIIDSYFGSIKYYLGDAEDSHIDLGISVASYPLISDLILDAIDNFLFSQDNLLGNKVRSIRVYLFRRY